MTKSRSKRDSNAPSAAPRFASGAEGTPPKSSLSAAAAQADRLANMGVLAAGIAHEINNPLAYVLTNVESLAEDLSQLHHALRRCVTRLEGELGAAALEAIIGPDRAAFEPGTVADLSARAREALDGIQRIREIAHGLGSFARIDEDKLRPVDVHEAIDAAITMVSNEVRFRARLVRDYREVPLVMADLSRLSQVFLDLLLNAAQAIEEGDVQGNEIQVHTSCVDGEVQILVSDSGCGIAAEHLARVFDPFFTTKGLRLGSGIGLSICHSIVAEHGGHIDVSSVVGQGTRFAVCLPAATKEQLDAASSKPPLSHEAPPRARLLVIDDEAPVRRAIRRILGNSHELVEAASGERAQALLREDRAFDLILCDLMMPGMSGMELHAWLVEEDALLADRVTFISGGAFTPQARAYLAKVDTPRMDKPFDRKQLQRWVADQLARCRRPEL